MVCLPELLRHREMQIELLTTYIRDPQLVSVRNHDNDDVTMGDLNTDQLIAVVDQQRRWYNSVSAGNCSDRRLKRQRTETGHFSVDSGVSANRRQNLTKVKAVESRDECPEITVPEKAGVAESHHQVAYALHWASTVILGLLVVEVRYYVCINLLFI